MYLVFIYFETLRFNNGEREVKRDRFMTLLNVALFLFLRKGHKSQWVNFFSSQIFLSRKKTLDLSLRPYKNITLPPSTLFTLV